LQARGLQVGRDGRLACVELGEQPPYDIVRDEVARQSSASCAWNSAGTGSRTLFRPEVGADA
jgi:hypothetical protein